jgi:hypothetical protein
MRLAAPRECIITTAAHALDQFRNRQLHVCGDNHAAAALQRSPTVPGDPISRLAFAKQEIDKHFGAGYADRHPETVNTIMICATLDWCAQLIAAALVEPDDGRLPPGTITRGLHLPR